MRRAIYYSNYELDHAKAIKYFRQALEVAQECNMHPLSPEVLGIKVELAHFLERTDHHEKAINVLELVRADCLKWIDERGGLEENAAARTRILQTAIRLAAKLGGLYADKNVMERELAEERVAWAVETSLKEKERRNTEGVKPDEGEWMDDEEFGAIFESQSSKSTPPLVLAPQVPCVNNLATSLAQQIPPPTPNMPPPSRTALIASARAWAQKARDVSAAVSGPERTEECDVGCAVATHNLGEFAEMEERVADARQFYSEAAGLAKRLGFEEGVGRAREGLRRLENRGRTIDADRASRQSTSSE
ncbi:MAG: hypothetical protein M1825_006198 [Sarcosagium campestre]|nr:MAG: hypothetical protein M1825_006198 [Sarcosagium campestre]